MILPSSRLATLLCACLVGGGLVSCSSDSAPDGNIFLNSRPPRYGHGGTDTPRYKYGATEAAAPGEAAPRGDTRYLNERKARDSAPREETREVSPEVGGRPRGSDEVRATEAPPRKLPAAEPKPISEPEPEPETAPAPEPKPAVAEDIPSATPVPGQAGKVYSPFSNGGYVDVSGMPSGSKARCPYTKKIFRVP